MTVQVLVGFPGGGKSYGLAEAAYRYRKSRLVFSNTPIEGTLQLDPDWLVSLQFPVGSLLLIDEAGIVFNSREWAKFPKETYLALAQHRKGGLDIIFGVQAPNRLDVVIRELASIWWECRSVRVPFMDEGPVLWFKQLMYPDPEGCFSGQEPMKVRTLIPWGRIYRSFDTYFMLEARMRNMVELLPWPPEQFIKQAGRPWGARLAGVWGKVKALVPDALKGRKGPAPARGADSDVTGGVIQ